MTGTRRLIFRQWLALLVLTVLTAAGAVTAIEMGRADAAALHAGEVPAQEGLAAAKESLIAADAAVVEQFAADYLATRDDTPTGRPLGPDESYRAAINAAGRQLTRVSQADVGGPAAESVQVVNGLLITYSGLVEQAFRDDAAAPLSQSYALNAHQFFEEEILVQLELSRADVKSALPGRPTAWRHLFWAVPLVLLSLLLAWTQIEVARRFRRTLSIPLLAGSLAVAGFAGTAVWSTTIDGRVAGSRHTLYELTAAYQDRQDTIRNAGCGHLGYAASTWSSGLVTCPFRPASTVDEPDLLKTANTVSTGAKAAADDARAATLAVTGLAGLAALLITLGLLPRIEEYRFRRR